MNHELTNAHGPFADTRDMYMAHTMFRREFALMPALVRGVTAGDMQRSQIVADHIELMVSVLHHYHEAEDKHLWPRLLNRVAAEIVPIVRLMEDQHQVIGAVIAEIDAAKGVWRNTVDSELGDVLADALDELVRHLNEHLSLQEEHILPVVETCNRRRVGCHDPRGGRKHPPRDLVADLGDDDLRGRSPGHRRHCLPHAASSASGDQGTGSSSISGSLPARPRDHKPASHSTHSRRPRDRRAPSRRCLSMTARWAREETMSRLTMHVFGLATPAAPAKVWDVLTSSEPGATYLPRLTLASN